MKKGDARARTITSFLLQDYRTAPGAASICHTNRTILPMTHSDGVSSNSAHAGRRNHFMVGGGVTDIEQSQRFNRGRQLVRFVLLICAAATCAGCAGFSEMDLTTPPPRSSAV